MILFYFYYIIYFLKFFNIRINIFENIYIYLLLCIIFLMIENDCHFFIVVRISLQIFLGSMLFLGETRSATMRGKREGLGLKKT